MTRGRPGFNLRWSHTKDSKMVLDASLHSTQHYKVRIKIKWVNPRKGVAPSPRPWCSSYQKGSLRVALSNGHQLYFFLLRLEKYRLFPYTNMAFVIPSTNVTQQWGFIYIYIYIDRCARGWMGKEGILSSASLSCVRLPGSSSSVYLLWREDHTKSCVRVNRHEDTRPEVGGGKDLGRWSFRPRTRGRSVDWLVGWFLCLMAYQLFLGYLMPMLFS